MKQKSVPYEYFGCTPDVWPDLLHILGSDLRVRHRKRTENCEPQLLCYMYHFLNVRMYR